MNETDKFALVPRPQCALEKAESSAKRVLADMVQDALALARTKVQAQNIPVLSKRRPTQEEFWRDQKAKPGFQSRRTRAMTYLRSIRTNASTTPKPKRQMTGEDAARKLNLPIGHPCEVCLRNGMRLRGKLSLVNEVLFIEEERLRELRLVLEGATFKYAEIESCVRLD